MIFAVHYTYSSGTAALRDEHRPAHRDWLSAGVDRGDVLVSGPYVDGSGALIMIEADGAEAAAAYMARDPFARAGALTAVRIVEFNPVFGSVGK